MYGVCAHALRPLVENIGFVAGFDQVMSGEIQLCNALEDEVYFTFVFLMGRDNAVWDGASFIEVYSVTQANGDELYFGNSEVVAIYAEELFSVARMAFMQKYGLKGAVLGEGLRGLIIEEKEIQWS